MHLLDEALALLKKTRTIGAGEAGCKGMKRETVLEG